MTAKPRKRFAQASIAAAAACAFGILACDVPLPLQNEADTDANLAETAADESPPSEITIVAGDDQAEPILYIDGERIYQNIEVVIDTLGRDRIDRIEVVKGAAAQALYGDAGADGVIHIYLKTDIHIQENDPTGG